MILLDTNVVLDVIQRREPHYQASAAVMDRIIRNKITGALSAHAITTVYFIIARHQNRDVAAQAIQWLLKHFTVASVGRPELLRAQALGWPDFEDAVVAAAAESSGCDTILSRNVRDFNGSPIPAVTPEEYLLGLEEK
ncbi:Predicted nucleic acid-binding protein, contains PIN domain [Modicisalibacter ilicicola DSM 19980]|uniref:Predicted nucleic acid-binding protein, contains PIN domain n=1 Tax=Modicisalibacter ilicicola DSM 19980 TaxID=1121942 RepID=A0A1M5DUT8_9GAMM|nr:PIN domain-containing protein [Halomonas ilicicola]SHF70690.1 Predicted nucleic acid-binding protein, contains PIN domain [Halomonas ilicicola DSM 19980]